MKTFAQRLAVIVGFLLATFSHAASPTPPQNLQQAWLGTESLLLWDDVSAATGYNIYRSDNTNTSWLLVGSSSVPRFRDPTFQFLPSFYVVTAVNADGESAGSDPGTVEFAEQFAISVAEPQWWDGTLSPTNAIIQWSSSDPNGAQGIVDWGLDSTNFNFFAINTNYLGSQRFDLTNLTPLTTYHYRLTSINSNRSGVLYVGSFGTPDTNHPPVADDYVSTWPSFTNGIWIPLRGHDSNFPQATLTYRIVSQPTNGTLSPIQAGWQWNEAIVIYTPATGARGYDYFRYIVNNGTWDSAPALVTLTNWINTPPAVTNGGMLTTAEDTPIAFVVPNFDAEGDPVTFNISPWSVWQGTISGTAPNLVFTPATNFNGSTWFNYSVSDGYEQANGWFQINVTPVNDKPEIRTNFFPAISTWEDQPTQIWLWVYDEEWTGNYELIQVTPPAHGTLTGNLWNLFYTPAANFFGTDYFTVAVREPDGVTSDPVTFPVTVSQMDDAPIALDQNVTGFEDTPLVIVPTGFDIEGDPLTFQAALYPTNGWLEQNGTNFIYHPMTNFIGQDAFSFWASDSWGLQSWAPAWIRIQVMDANDAPVAFDTHYNLHTDIIVARPFSVVDLDGNNLVCEIIQPPIEGTVTVTGTNFTYTPEPGLFDYEAFFKYRAWDGFTYGNEAWVILWIGRTNTTPVAQDQSVSTRGDQTLTFQLAIQEADFDEIPGGILDAAPTHGTVQFTTNGAAIYTPATGFLGTDTFTYRPYDGFATGNLATVTVTITPPNRPPVANNSSVTVNEDSGLSLTLSASDPDGDGLTYELITGTTHGVLMGFGASRTYQPSANFSGADSLTFRVFDGQYYSGNATVSITVTPVNDAPVASNSTVTTYEDTPVTLTMNGSDVDNNITSLTFNVVTPPAHGTVGSGNRVRTYTPVHDYNGPDSFTFQISDGSALGNIATVNINVLPVNDPPSAKFQIITNYEDTTFPITLIGTDVDGDALTFGILTPPYVGTLTGTAPNLTYRPITNWNSGSPITNADSFIFWVSDGAFTKSNVVTIILLPVNDRPIANNQSRTTAEDTSINITLAGSDVDGDVLTFAVVNGPANGTLSGTAPNLVYRPITNFFGNDAFIFSVSDGVTSSAPATVSITVTAVQDAPSANALSITTAEDTAVNVTLTGSDVDNDPLSFTVVSNPMHGTLTGTAPNLVYAPAADYYGSDSFIFSVSDGITNSAATVSITVTPVNDLPTPDGLRRRIYDDGIVRLWWNGVPGAQSYNVYRANVTNGPFTLLTNGVTTTNFNDATALWQQTYSYRVTTWDGAAEGTPSNPMQVRWDGTGLITTYEQNWLILGTTARVQFCSSLVSGTEGLWEYGTSTNYDRVLENTNLLGCQNFNLGPLTPQTLYYFRLTATDSNGNAVAYWNSFTTRAAPVADPQSTTMPEDNTRDFTLTGHAAAGSGYTPPITYSIASSPAHGTLTFLSGSTFRYRPTTNFNGADSFTFKVNDTDMDSAPATVSITVTPVNDPPVITVLNPATNWQITASTVTPRWSTDVPVNAQIRYGPMSGPLWWVASPNYGTQHSLTISNLVPDWDYVYVISVWTTSGDTNWTSGGFHTATNHAPVTSNQTVYATANVATNIYPTVSDADAQTLRFTVIAASTNGGIVLTNGNSLRYLPPTNFVGIDGFTYRADDGFATSQVASVTIYVFAPNGAPIALPYSTNTLEDVPVAVPFRGFDAQSNTLSFLPLVLPGHGTLTLTSTNATYRPATNYNGFDSFTYRAFDGTNFSAPASVSLTITPVNDRPIANNQSVTATEDVPLSITLTGSDVDFNSLTYTIVSWPTHGVLGTIGVTRTYTPDPNYNGPDSFTFFVNDGTTNSATATVSITVTAVNDAPVALMQSLTLAEDTSVSFTLGGTDVDGDALTFEVIASPTKGTLSIAGTNYTYRPGTNFFGSDGFTFRAFDATLWSAPAGVSITVTSVFDAPIAFAQSVTAGEDASRSIVLTAYDGDGDTLIYSIVTPPAHGALSGTPPNVSYQPGANYNGPDSFTFNVSDGNTISAPAMISITVSPANDAPAVTNRTFSTSEDVPLNFTLSGSDVDGDTLTIEIISQPSFGTISGTGPSFTYTPNANFHGNDTFLYTATDGTEDGNAAVVFITVASVNDAPVANAQSVTTDEDSAVSITVTATDVDGDALSYSIVAAPVHGTLSGSAPNFTYTPATNYNGADNFTFSVSDGTTSTVAAVAITITPVNDTPVANPQSSVTVDEDSSVAITLTGSDVDGDALTFSIVTSPVHGVLGGTIPNLTYTPNANFNGADGFSFKVNDGQVDGNTASVSINVRAVNDAPMSTNLVAATDEDMPVTIAPAGSDLDGDAISFILVAPAPQFGTVSFVGTNFVYTPATNFVGEDVFSYAATDGQITGAVATVTVTVRPVNDAPIANNQSISLAEDSSKNITLTGSDVDGDSLSFAVVNGPTHGTLSGSGANLTYTPNTNFNGSDSFTFKANDGVADGNIATVSITVTPVNDAPVANPQSVNTPEDTSASITLTGTDVDGNPLTYLIITDPTHGALNTNAGASVTYTPAANYNGPDSFVFRVSDGSLSNTATVSINVTAVNDAPVANPQSVLLAEDSSLPITLTGSDVEGSALTFNIVSAPTHGTLSGTAPNLTYRPATNYNGADSFTFAVNDGSSNSSAAVVSVTVTAVNDAPIANPQSVSLAEDSSLAITLTGSDVEGSALTYAVLSSPTHGTLTGTAPNLTYRPATNYNGADSFTFKVNDGSLNSGTATVSIAVTAVNDAPIANGQSVTVTYNTATAITLSGSDLEGSALTYTVVSGPTNGALSGTAPNLTYTPTVGSAGADQFTFRVNDGSSNSAGALVSITTQNPVAIPPAPSSLSVTVPTASNTLVLNWSCTATNEDGFKIERSPNGVSSWAQIATTGINIHNYTNNGLANKTTYYYRVRSYNRLGNSAYSNTANGKTR